MPVVVGLVVGLGSLWSLVLVVVGPALVKVGSSRSLVFVIMGLALVVEGWFALVLRGGLLRLVRLVVVNWLTFAFYYLTYTLGWLHDP